MATDFTKQVIAHLKKIPKGKVATYGQIATLAGSPQGARGVSWILHSSTKKHNLPWHRVLNSKGQIAFPQTTRTFKKQKHLLLSENIHFLTPTQVNLKKHLWSKKPKKSPRYLPKMFS